MPQLQPAIRGLAQLFSEAETVTLHLSEQRNFFRGLTAECPFQPVMPVIAMQGPVDHHKS